MKRLFSHALCLLFALGCATSAAAQAGDRPGNWCRNGAFPSDTDAFKLGRVAGQKGSRVYFYGDDEGCPGPAAKCRQKAYLIPGDRVIVSHAFGDWLCAWYQPARGTETVGWLPAGRLEVTAAEVDPPAASWLGEWGFYDNSLKLSRGKEAGALRVEGAATWVGINPGNVHVGEVSDEGVPAGNVLRLGGEDEYDCRATLRLVGPYLVVSDNKQCGGANVTFDGVYRRKR